MEKWKWEDPLFFASGSQALLARELWLQCALHLNKHLQWCLLLEVNHLNLHEAKASLFRISRQGTVRYEVELVRLNVVNGWSSSCRLDLMDCWPSGGSLPRRSCCSVTLFLSPGHFWSQCFPAPTERNTHLSKYACQFLSKLLFTPDLVQASYRMLFSPDALLIPNHCEEMFFLTFSDLNLTDRW